MLPSRAIAAAGRIGIATRGALATFAAGNDALASGIRSEDASGNGSIMRLAPVTVRYAQLYPSRGDELARLAEESSLPTHASPQCLSACRYLANAIRIARSRRKKVDDEQVNSGVQQVCGLGRWK